MKVYKQKFNMLVPSSPGKDVNYPRLDNERLWLDAYTYLVSLPPNFILHNNKRATNKEIKLYYTLKKLRKL